MYDYRLLFPRLGSRSSAGSSTKPAHHGYQRRPAASSGARPARGVRA